MRSSYAFFLLVLIPSLACAQVGGVDDFDDSTIDPSKWVVLDNGSGLLEVRGGSLQFDSSGVGSEFRYLGWANASYDEDFEVVFRVGNTTLPASSGETAGVGLEIYPAGSDTTALNVRLGSYFVDGFGPSRDLLANFFESEGLVPGSLNQPATIFPKAAAVRLMYTAADQIFTVFYDANPTDGVQWTLLSTFGVSSAADAAVNHDFAMSAGDEFEVLLYGSSFNLDADFGELTLDDFQFIEAKAAAPVATLESSAAVTLTTQLGKRYSILRSTDLSADPAFTAVHLSGSGGTFRIVPVGQGQLAVTGTGRIIQILDPTTPSHEAAFYKIVTQ